MEFMACEDLATNAAVSRAILLTTKKFREIDCSLTKAAEVNEVEAS